MVDSIADSSGFNNKTAVLSLCPEKLFSFAVAAGKRYGSLWCSVSGFEAFDTIGLLSVYCVQSAKSVLQTERILNELDYRGYLSADARDLIFLGLKQSCVLIERHGWFDRVGKVCHVPDH